MDLAAVPRATVRSSTSIISSAGAVLAAVRDHVAARFAVEGDPAHAAGKTLVLSEPVTILRGPAYDGTQLPKGTAVKLIAAEGDFLRVRYLQSVIMIPRTATVAGAYRLN